MAGNALTRLRIICLALPQVAEKPFGKHAKADPEQFFVPPHVGPKGWVGVRLDRRIDWKGVTQLVTDSYRMIAPKRLADSVWLRR